MAWRHALVALFPAASASVVEHPRDASRLRIINACHKEHMWIAHEGMGGVGPDVQNIKIGPEDHHDFIVFDGLHSTRYWPKLRCDEDGNNCELGESGGPGESCDKDWGCAPPVDTKFEATFGTVGGHCDDQGAEGCDFVDMSLVDGFTLPFKLEIEGDECVGKYGNTIDCSKVNLDECPDAEDMGSLGNLSLKVKNLKNQKTVGCYAPCSKLTYRQWNNTIADGHMPGDATCKDYCCPTPPESVKECRSGPVVTTEYVQAVHRFCPGVYGYAYDDGVGLISCPAGTKYQVTFHCPPGRWPPLEEEGPAKIESELIV